MSWLDDIVTSYRDHGLTVVEPTSYDWRSFGAGNWRHGRPVGTTKHHFVISYDSPDSTSVSMLTNGYAIPGGRLPGPVANTGLGKTGTVYMIAGRVANHGGKGIREVIDRVIADLPCRGDAWRPDDWGYNGEISASMWGTECHHPGTAVPMPAAQLSALIRMSAAECQAMGWSANRVLMHLEQTTRKQDINRAVITGASLRAQVAAILGGGRPPTPTPTPTPAPSRDWYDMATRKDLDEALYAMLTREDVITNLAREVMKELAGYTDNKYPYSAQARAKIAESVWSRALKSRVDGKSYSAADLLTWIDTRAFDMQPRLKDAADRIRGPLARGWDQLQDITSRLDKLGAPSPFVPATHVVAKGETLAAIAQKHGKSVADLVKWNEIADPNVIAVGDVLKLSAS